MIDERRLNRADGRAPRMSSRKSRRVRSGVRQSSCVMRTARRVAVVRGQEGREASLVPQRLLWVEEVATILGVPVKTLYQWRYKGVGPAGVRIGRHLRYRAADVEAWIDQRVVEPGPRRFA